MDLLISDLHLHESRPETAQLFFDFIAGPAQHASRLFILGDLFEYWAGDDDLDTPLHRKVCYALKGLAEKGAEISMIVGNRDFLIGSDFAAASGTTLLPDVHTTTIGGTPTLLLHGDTLCTDDAAYQQFRREVRDPAFIRDFLRRPLAQRKAYIENLRQRSESEKQVKSALIMDVNADAVAATFRTHAANRIIHGHTHRLATHRYDIDGRPCERWVLGDWGKAGNYLECNPTGWRFCAWDGRTSSTISTN